MPREEVTVAASAASTWRCTRVAASAAIARNVRLQARVRETPASALRSELSPELRNEDSGAMRKSVIRWGRRCEAGGRHHQGPHCVYAPAYACVLMSKVNPELLY